MIAEHQRAKEQRSMNVQRSLMKLRGGNNMHAKTLIFTEKKVTEREIAEILAPHCEDVDGEYNSDGFWDWYRIGGRYKGSLTPKKGSTKTFGERSWTNKEKSFIGADGCYIKDLDAEMYKRSLELEKDQMLEKIKEEDSDFVKDLYKKCVSDIEKRLIEEPDYFSCYQYVDVDGKYNSRSFWNGEDFIDNDKFDDQLKEVVKNKELFVTVVDCHS
jgi:hypothetical protein